MSNNGDDPYDPYEVPVDDSPEIFPGGPLDCQDCGAPMGKQMAAGFLKQVNGVMYVAGICPECMVERLGLEWREMQQSTIVVPGQTRVT